MEQMREHVAHEAWKVLMRHHAVIERVIVADDIADAALSLMQPEIDRRVAEEKARLLERLREPSEAMIESVCQSRYDISGVRWDDGLTEGVARIERMKAEKAISAIHSVMNAKNQ